MLLNNTARRRSKVFDNENLFSQIFAGQGIARQQTRRGPQRQLELAEDLDLPLPVGLKLIDSEVTIALFFFVFHFSKSYPFEKAQQRSLHRSSHSNQFPSLRILGTTARVLTTQSDV